MTIEADVMAALQTVRDPELGRNVVELNMVRALKVKAGKVSFTLALTIPNCPLREQISRDARAAVLAVPGVSEVDLTLSAMTDEERKAVFAAARPELPKLKLTNQVKQVIAITSGKGGVGKSSLTALLASSLARQGQKVGVLDADITGPSIPRLFGLPWGGLSGGEQGILPAVTRTGVRVISTNLMLKEESAAVIWRGPMISSLIRQFWTDVLWGKLDTLLVDLPPGTSDATITVMSELPICGAVLVTTPQQLAAMVVNKAVHMLQQMKVDLLGVVENMSYYDCPDSGKPHYVFGPSHADEVAAAAGVPVWARLPILPQVAELGDAGQIEAAVVPEIDELAKKLMIER